MDIDSIIIELNKEIATRESDNFGIKCGEGLYHELNKRKLIEYARFSLLGAKTSFADDLPAYKKKYAISIDPNLEDYEFFVGIPSS